MARLWLTRMIGQAALGPQPAQEVENLGLDRDVEGRGRLVEEEDARLEDQGAGDGDALALAARELVRVAVAEGGPEADLGQEPLDPPVGVAQPVDRHGLAQDAVDRVARVERAVGVLEDHLAELVEGLGPMRRLRRAGDPDGSRPAVVEAGEGPQHGRLARPGLADEAERAAFGRRRS